METVGSFAILILKRAVHCLIKELIVCQDASGAVGTTCEETDHFRDLDTDPEPCLAVCQR